ncbi:ankyrin repeat-containing domain protein [Aspergillus pseudotamarii]|uniref:Ankyrin repeat-containing domain protein n=1 Tax=Aspergillus pseudotamarii TaxID=132259 RepID=A0A5N6T512_ASPPS|nr:ankyrin repeat-containing domain protein [Aspergillus pseudotamarii]KAE8141403.1 ankyrin repeat-containing domain protein [Aspergillus pseudotamarii]
MVILSTVQTIHETTQDIDRGVKRLRQLGDDQEYQAVVDWLTPTLFCPGIPGAGKTMITATTIDYLYREYRNKPMTSITYIFAISDSSTNSGILSTLYSVAGSYSKVFIVIDALDECQVSNEDRARFLHYSDTWGMTSLSRAANGGHEAVVKLLLEWNAGTEEKSRKGDTPLIMAADNGHEAVVRALLGRNASVEAKNNSAYTALLLAVQNGYKAVASLLLEKGANT